MRGTRSPWLLLAPLLLAACLSAGCGAPGGPRGADGTSRRIAVLVPPSERPAWLEVARAFSAARPEIGVDVVEGPQATDLRENLYTTSLLARDPSFDLIYLDVTWTPKFADAGWLLPLDDRVPPEELAAFLPAALGAGRYRGRLYRLPVRTDCGLLYWRRDWLEEAGLPPPETFEDLTRVARALQSPPERWGFVWQGKQYEGLVCDYLEVLRGHGGFWIDPESGAVGLDRPEAIEALAFLRDCVAGADPISPPGVATYQEEESRRLFQDGRAVFLRNWPYAWRLAQADDSPLKGRIGAGPMVRTANGRRTATLGGWGFGVSAYSRRPDDALAFARFAASLEGQRLLCRDTGYAPARAEAYGDSALLAANPFLATIARVHAAAVPRPTFARYALASDILQRQLSAALAGTTTPEAALRRAAAQTRALVKGVSS